MAIVNLTPDSFYETSRNMSERGAAEAIMSAVSDGASIVDIGGYSSRPGAANVDVDEEWRRVRMGLKAASKVDCGVVLSVDTFRSEVVRRAYEEFGPIIVNDISAGEIDEAMVSLVARYNIPYVAMHMRGTPESMGRMTEYPDGVVRGVVDYFASRIPQLEQAGVDKRSIILDPGFGFAKSVEQNWQLLRGLDALRAMGQPLLVGVSRKSMIYRLLDITPDDALAGSLSIAWEVLRGGAAILRVHDVAATCQVMKLCNYYKGLDR